MKKSEIIIPTEKEVEVFGGKKKLIKPDEHKFLIEPPENFGTIPVRQEIEIIPTDPIKSLSLGWTVTENIGIGVFNPRGLKSFDSRTWEEEVRDIINEEERKTKERNNSRTDEEA